MPQLAGTVSSSGDTTLLAAVTGRALQVWGLQWGVTNATITAKLISGSTDKAAITGLVGENSVVAVSGTKEPVFQGAVGEALKINLSGAGTVFYNLQYSHN